MSAGSHARASIKEKGGLGAVHDKENGGAHVRVSVPHHILVCIMRAVALGVLAS